MRLTVQQIIEATGARVSRAGASGFDSFGIDSRTMLPGGLFFALKGTQSDGHLYVEDAARHGAAGAVVEREVESTHPLTLFRVPDSLRALHDLASWIRKRSAATFVGITGSSGKTSTKEFTAALLAERYGVYRSEGNLNSTTGLPLSLLAMEEQPYAVFEIGMNQPGEITGLTSLLQPHVGALLNINPVHLGQFPSVDAIAEEKLSLIRTMSSDSTAVYNCDDPMICGRLELVRQKKISFGFSPDADLRITDVTTHGVGGSAGVFAWQQARVPFETRLCGRGHLQNIAAATCIALVLGVRWDEIVRGIKKLEPYQQRGRLIQINGIHVYDDSYNSNPRALGIALETVGQSAGFTRRIAILGDMLELGPGEAAFHEQAGEAVAANNFDILIATGPLSKHMAGSARRAGMKEVLEAPDSRAAGDLAARIVRKGDLVLVKGSRGLKMETVIEALVRLG